MGPRPVRVLILFSFGVFLEIPKKKYCSTARGKVWGSDEVNIEGWKPLKRLPGHESGVWLRFFVQRDRIQCLPQM